MSEPKGDAKAFFLAALECDDAEALSLFLDEACGADAALRGRVEVLLQANREAGRFLGGAGKQEADFDDSPAASPATVIGPYKLLELIGEGGMGVVWMAQQTAPVTRLVALKLIKAGMDSKQVIARFEAERQALALMDHANIARVLDAGATDAGLPYFVMDLVKGVPITRYCDERRLTPRQRLELFIPVCQAVQHAHQKGIIHRDLKPSNVLVALYDGKPVPKVIDFGVAKAAGQALTDKTLVTGYGNIIGTLEYMSPEQAEINQLDIDTRSDIYSLGVLLYELLTGSPPFSRIELENAGMLEMLRVIREQEPSKPSTKLSTADSLPTLAANRGTEPAKLTKLVRGELDWIVMKALEKDRGRRYETANGFAMDVQRYLDDEPVQACPPSVGYRLRKFGRRNKWALGTVALLALMLTVMAAAVAENFRREAKAQEEDHKRSLQMQKDEASKREELARRLATTESAVGLALARSESLADQAAQMPTTTSKEAAAAVAVFRQADGELAQAEAALVTGTARSALRERVASARRRFNQASGKAEQQHARALREEKLRRDLDEAALARAASTGDQIDAATAADLFAKAFKDYGLELKPGQTAALAKQIRAEKPEQHDALIVALDDWAFVAMFAPDLIPAEELRSLAQAADDDPWRIAYRDAVTKDDLTTLKDLAKKARDLSLPASSVCLLAQSLYYRDQRTEAVALLRWARDRQLKDVWIPFQLGIMLGSGPRRPAAEIEEQVGCFRVFLAMRPESAIALNNLGVSLASQGKFEVSIDCFRTAVKYKPEYAMAHSNLGNFLGKTGKLKDALVAHDEAVRLAPGRAQFHNNRAVVLLESKLVDDAIAANELAIKLNPKLAVAHSNLGNALHTKSLLKQALAACEEAIRLDPNLPEAYSILGSILADQKKTDDAIVALENAIRLDPNFAVAYGNLALTLCDKKKYTEAEKHARKALDLQPSLAHAHSVLGLALVNQDKDIEATASFREAVRHSPDYVEAHYHLGQVLLKQKQTAEAMTELELTIKLDPRHAGAHLQIGKILVERQQYAEAAKFFQQAIVFKEDLAEAHMLLGLSRWELNDFGAAGKSFKDGLRLDPNSAMTHFYLGRLHELQKQPEAAIASFKEAIRLKPDHASSHYNLGTLLADKNQLDAAADALRQAIKWDKKHAKAHNNLGIVLARQGKVADAIPCFREALKCEPKYPLARAMLAQALNAEAWPLVVPMEASRADAERTVKMAGEAVELDPKVAEYWNTLGVGNFRAGNWDEAITALKKSASMNKANDWCDFLFLAMAHGKKGDKAAAQTWYDRGVARIKEQRVNTDESRRFHAEAAAVLGLAKESN